ncbi:MAG: STAS/SEC14 domain-containing protein [Planctomycetaceae bacterium]|nr:STAS/SEC14 domain-containing protein [Planctomycetaceae bacterium]
MQWHVDTKAGSSVSTSVVTGDLDANDYFQMREQVRLYQIAQGGISVLLDLRDAVLHFGTLDVFAVASTHQDTFPRGAPFAILTGPATISPGDARFLENVLVNRGTLAKLFTDEVAAHEWLQACLAEHQP